MKKIIVLLFLLLLSAASNPFAMHYVAEDKDGMVTIDNDNIALDQLLKELSQKQHKNIIFLGEIKKKIQLHLFNVSPDKAFNAAIVAGALSQSINEDLITIGSFRQINALNKRQRESVQHEYDFSLHYLNLGDFIPILLQKKDIEITEQNYKNNTFKVRCSTKNLNEIKLLLQQYDLKPKQIRIRAYIVSIDQDYLAELGLKFGAKEKNTNLFTIFSNKISSLNAELRALEQHGQGKIISAPELITINNKQAYIETGDEIPYYESDNNGQSTVVFKKAVLSLKFLPKIIGNKSILLHVTISQDQPGQSYAGTLSIKTRKIDTDAIVNSGESLVLGGIFEQHKSNIDTKVPFLGDLPILGKIFSLDEDIIKKRQLVMFILPEVIM